MQDRKTLNASPFISKPKSQLIDEKDWNLPKKKISYLQRHKGETKKQ